MRSTARIALQVLGALFGVLAVLFALGAWRLSSGPLSLGFLSPYIQEALEGDDLPYLFEFEDTVLVWAGWGEALEIRLTELRIADTNGDTLAAVPAASLGLSGAALLRGTIAPTSIELIEPRFGLVRRPDGSVHLAGGGEGVSTDDAASDALVADLLDPPREDHPLSQLKRVSLRDAALVLRDEVADLTWTAPDADLTLDLDDAAILGHLSMELHVQELEIVSRSRAVSSPGEQDGQRRHRLRRAEPGGARLHRPRPGGFGRTPRSTLRHARVRRGSRRHSRRRRLRHRGRGGGGRPARGFSCPGSGSRVHRRRLDRRRAVADRSRVLRRRYRPPQLLPGRRTLAVECRCRFQGAIPGERYAVRFARHVLAEDVHRERPRMDRAECRRRRDHALQRRSRYRAGRL